VPVFFKEDNMSAEDIAQRDIILTKASIDILKDERNFLELIGLYVFYYYTAVWQKTNQPRCTTSYTAMGTGLSETKIRNLKKTLMELGFIKNVVTKNPQGQITGHYIKVKFYRHHPNGFPGGGSHHPWRKREGNAYRDNKENAYKDNTVTAVKTCDGESSLVHKKRSKTFDEKCSLMLEQKVRRERKVFRKINQSQWSSSFRNFRTRNGIKKERIKQVLQWYIKHWGEDFVPAAYSARGFCNKFLQIEDAMTRHSELVQSGQAKIKIIKRINGKRVN
jgi:hypothetical protein